MEKPALSALKDFFESDLGELSAAGVKLAMSHVRNEFGEYDQHDAMEFLTVLLETIENEIGDAAACPSRKNFLWRIDHELKCAACGKANTIQETMYALTLQIEPDERESVETLLERFFATRACIECDDEACRTKRANHPGASSRNRKFFFFTSNVSLRRTSEARCTCTSYPRPFVA